MTDGIIVRVRREPGGSGLAVALAGGELSLTVDWAIDFTPGERGLARIGSVDGDETVAYTDVDVDDTETVLTLEAPGVVLPWEVGDPVTPLDVTGMPEEAWFIDVDLGDEGEQECRPSHALQDKLREDEDYVGIRCEVVGDEVTTLYDRAASIEPSAFQAPMFVGYLAANQTIPTGTGMTAVASWVPKVLRGGMQYDVGTGKVVVPIPGWYSMAGVSAVTWAFNASGRRVTQPAYDTAAGVVTGGLYKQDASPDPVQQTTPVISQIEPLEAADTAYLTVSQTSGGGLDLIGSASGTETFLCVKYEGPL